MANIIILGSGGWGIALAINAYYSGNSVTLWTPFEEEKENLINNRSSKLLSGVDIPKDILITSDLFEADNKDIIIIATPSFAVEETADKLKQIKNLGRIVIVSKGLQTSTCKRFSEVVEEKLPLAKVSVLSGPSHAEEVARYKPTSLVVASKDTESAIYVQKTLMNDTLRIYTGDDIVGVELGGALKNIIAVAAGACDGLELGDNPKAALITRGLAEMTRLGVAMGGKLETFAGLAGLGDLIVTCNSIHSRNNRFGKLIGQGVDVASALKEVGTVEGYHAVKQAYQLSQKYNLEMPITEAVYASLYKGEKIKDMVKKLMTRPSKAEHEKIWNG